MYMFAKIDIMLYALGYRVIHERVDLIEFE